MKPTITIIIPSYNCEHYIAEALESAINQTMKDIEILVIDDGSMDGTRNVIKRYAEKDCRIRNLINVGNIGVAEARNRGFDVALGDYIALLDADDRWLPNKLEKQLNLVNETGSSFCYTAYSFIGESGKPIKKIYHVPETTDIKLQMKENVIGCSTVLFSRDVVDKVRMRKDYVHEDYVFWMEVLMMGYKVCGLDEPLVEYRILKNSRSGDKKKAALGRWHIYRDFLGLNLTLSAMMFINYMIQGIKKHYI